MKNCSEIDIYGLVCCIISKKIEGRMMKEESKSEQFF